MGQYSSVPVYKRALRRCTQQLVEELDFDSITDYLISREVFPSVRLRNIKVRRTEPFYSKCSKKLEHFSCSVFSSPEPKAQGELL